MSKRLPLSLGSVLGVMQGLRTASKHDRPLVVSGPPSLVALLAEDLRRGGVDSMVREQGPLDGASVLIHIVAGGIVFAFLFQIFVNVGMTIGIAPVTGIPLPMVSVGGSSMVANLVAIGILQAIYVRGRGRARIRGW